MLRRIAQAACALALMATSAGASAQNAPPLALNRFYPAPAGDRMFGVQSPYVAGDLTPHFAVLADYAHNPFVLRTVPSREDQGSVLEHQLFLHLNASFAIKSRLLINVAFPIAVFQAGDSPSGTSTGGAYAFTSPDSADIGDLRAGLRFRIFGEYFDPFQIAIGGYVWFPTGNSESGSLVGEGTVRGLPQLILGGRIADRVVWALNGGPDLRSGQTFGSVVSGSQGTMFRVDGGLGFLLDDDRNLQLGVEGNAAFLLDNQTEDPIERAANFEAMAGLKYRFLDDFEIGAGAGPGFTRAVGTPDVRAVASLAYTPKVEKEPPPPNDTDGDGIADPQDACPLVKGLTSPDPKLHGCPDTDGDGILDPKDACPTVKGIASEDPKTHGCPDTDGDGIFDAQDACSQVKGVPNANPKLHGCADTDGDGIFDPEDACPLVKGVPNQDPKQHGCPPDTDGDGIIDAEDACVDIKGIKTEDPKTNGCPGDRDNDTVRDDKDACPDEKGKPDPDPTKNGCPVAVRVTETEVIILQQVQFDTGKATIKKVSDPLLDEVAEVLRDHPEILKIEVQGHTDSRGSAALNTKLSQDRAESVKAALVKRGISEGRLTPKGYGPDKPIGDNKTDAGRQKNRRVQFVIIDKTTKDKAPPKDPVPATATPPAGKQPAKPAPKK